MDVDRPARSASKQQRAHDRIHLNVGGERFTTTRSTLELSTSYFASTFADEWADSLLPLNGFGIENSLELDGVRLISLRRRGILTSEFKGIVPIKYFLVHPIGMPAKC